MAWAGKERGRKTRKEKGERRKTEKEPPSWGDEW